jgi:photosystem II stability/assembly factor-like uncharacterized protein
MKTILFALLIGFASLAIARAEEWQWQNPTPQGSGLNDIFMENASDGWAVGGNGTIVRTTNGGANWTVQRSCLDENYNAVWFRDASHGWVAGYRWHGENEARSWGVILATTDGGATWVYQYDQSGPQIRDLVFANATDGWAVGQWDFHTGFIIRTTDGGAHWGQPIFDSTQVWSVDFVNDSTGWAGTDHGLLHTADRGITWSRVNSNLGNWGFYRTQFFDPLIGFALTSHYSNYLVSTTNGGAHWQPASPSDVTPMDFHFFDPTTGWVLSHWNRVCFTDDGGATWTIGDSIESSYLTAIAGLGESDLWVAGEQGATLHSGDGGVHWSQQAGCVSGMSRLHSVAFADSLHGWVANDNLPNPGILSTADGGETWNQQYFGPRRPRCLSCVGVNHVWAGCDSGVVLHSANGGQTWSPLYTGSPDGVPMVKFINPLTGWAVQEYSDRNPVLHTTDGGLTWIPQNWGIPGDLWDFVFVNENLGWATGGSEFGEAVRHTTDGGNTWVDQQADHPGNSVSFVDSLHGWITGTIGILHTSDGGQTWSESPVPENLDVYNVSFADTLNGFMSCYYDSKTLHTSDGGVTWDVHTLPAYGYFHAMSAPDAHHCWLVSWYGEIIKWDGTVNSAPERPHLSPASVSLSAYPNPFNSTTALSFEIPTKDRTTLQVYDLTGRLVTTLADRVYLQGRHEIRFDGSNLASGIYFARLKSNQVTTARKLVLLK